MVVKYEWSIQLENFFPINYIICLVIIRILWSKSAFQDFNNGWKQPRRATIHSVQFSSVQFSSVQFGSVAQSCLTLCNSMNHSMPGLLVHHQLPESTQTHVHWVGDAIQPSHPLSSPSPLALNLSQPQGLFQWVSSSHQVAKVLELQL